MEDNLEIVKASEFGLSEEKAEQIQNAFSPVIAEKEALTELYKPFLTAEITPELCAKAKELRLKLVKVRTSTASIHKAEKGFFLAAGRFVDAWKNKNTVAVQQMESKLAEIENYYINLEKERIEKLTAERNALISTFTEFYPENLGEMQDSVFENYFNGLKLAHQQKLEAEAKAEAERLEAIRLENERLEAQRLENIRLKKEAEKREKEIQKERAKIEAERLERERLAEIERKKQAEILEAERKKAAELARIEAEKQAKIQAELRAKAEAERLERERLQAEKEAKEKAEAESEKLAYENEQKELQKGDKEKFETLISDLQKLKTKYSFDSELNKNKMKDVSLLLDKIINHIS